MRYLSFCATEAGFDVQIGHFAIAKKVACIIDFAYKRVIQISKKIYLFVY